MLLRGGHIQPCPVRTAAFTTLAYSSLFLELAQPTEDGVAFLVEQAHQVKQGQGAALTRKLTHDGLGELGVSVGLPR